MDFKKGRKRYAVVLTITGFKRNLIQVIRVK